MNIAMIAMLLIGIPLIIIFASRLINLGISAVPGPAGVKESRYIEIGGIEQHIRIRMSDPDNPVILFLHGGPGFPIGYLSYVFQPYIDADFTTVHWDQRHCGRTYFRNRGESGDLSPEQMLEDLDQLVDYLIGRFAVDGIIILGQSWGSVLGTMYAAEHPEKVTAYVGVGQVVDFDAGKIYAAETAILSAADRGDRQRAEMLEGAQSQFRKADSVAGLDIDNLVSMISHSVDELKGDREASGLRQMWYGISSPDMSFRDLRWFLKATDSASIFALEQELVEFMYYDFDLLSRGGNFEVPVYFISGENDWITPTAMVREAFEAIDAPESAMIILPGTGHAMFLDQPGEFADALRELLGGSAGSAAKLSPSAIPAPGGRHRFA
jgi:pimeloyl-ACP methyl ester carboxylesterase